MLFGADWLANVFLGCFLFGLIFTALSLLLNVTDLNGAAPGNPGAQHIVGHLGQGSHGPHVGHGPAPAAHGGHAAHGPAHTPTHTHPHSTHHNAAEQVGAIGPLNLPTILAGLTWFGGAGYLLRTLLGLNGIASAALALLTGIAGAALVFLVLSRVLWPGQTEPMRRADFHLPGTQARVISGIAAAGGTGEIVFYKGGSRRVEGARSESGSAIERGVVVTVVRYERGLAYVDPVGVTSDIPPPTTARVERLPDADTRALNGSAPAITEDLRRHT